MKAYLKFSLMVLVAAFLMAPAYNQDNRTLDTKVADILAQFPAKDARYTELLMKNIIDLGPDGIAKFCDMIIPPGTGDDTQARYALASLARYAGAPGQENIRGMVENGFLAALAKASDKEVKSFFIRRLALCGQSGSVSALEKYLDTDDLYAPAVATLTSIGTEEAAGAIFRHTRGKTGPQLNALVKDLGVLHYEPAEEFIISLAGSPDAATLEQVYRALAGLGGVNSAEVFREAAQKAGYSADKTGIMMSCLQYARRMGEKGELKLSHSLCDDFLKKCIRPDQLQFRSAALGILRHNEGTAVTDLLLKEIRNSDKAYRNAVLRIAGENLTPEEVSRWIDVMKKVPPETQGEILTFLAHRTENDVLRKAILPSLNSEDTAVRNEAVKALVVNQQDKALPVLLDQLTRVKSDSEYPVIEDALLTVCSARDGETIASRLKGMNTDGQVVLIHVLASRRATSQFSDVEALCSSDNDEVKAAAYSALPRLAKSGDLTELIALLRKTGDPEEITSVQGAIEAIYTGEEHPEPSVILKEMSTADLKEKLIPVLPYLHDENGLKTLVDLLKNGKGKERDAAFMALMNWTGASALPVLFDVFTDPEFKAYRDDAMEAYLDLVGKADIPDDQRLLWIEKIMPACSSVKAQREVIDAAGSVKTFLSLVFVSKYLDRDDLARSAAYAVTRLVLPSPGESDGLTGKIARQALLKAKEKLTGPDSQYVKIDIQEYLDKMPDETGYVSIFDGKDLDGWQGLVKDPLARAKMSPKELAREQAEADMQMGENWAVKDGCIVFNGKGANLCTKKIYKDFDMLVDWRITKNGDSGIYLKGTPQIQIWDTSRVDVGAQVGSGGLYNNEKHRSTPLVLADNAIGDWNTFRIHMTGDVVTVYLNGILVVDHVVMENYWDRGIPLFSEGPIELQAHGTDLAFRNLYVKTIDADEEGLSADEKAEGFVSLFNGKDLGNWVGNKTDYSAEEGCIIVNPKDGNHGNLYTEKEYSNFVFRFEFLLTPGANNGLGIHAPLTGDAAYVGKELQILDNTAPIYAHLQPYQYHGSVYGIIPAKRGFLKPVGEWNFEQVEVRGDNIKITLNGSVIVDGNVKEATRNGTPDHKDHPGLERHTGHIGFLGHGSVVKFRNIRIKEL